MPLLIKIGIFVSLITWSIGKSIPSENNEETNSTSSYEEPLENNCNCEWRYYQHYETKGCQVVQVNSCGCPKKFLCPLASEATEDKKTCIFQNQEYKLGSRINITDKCLSCRCLATEETAQIVCRHKECPQLEYMGDENCHLVYEKDHCCPTKYECGSFCVFDGVTYPLGAKIYPADDPCLVCECTENWVGVSNSSCYRQNCLLEKNKLQFRKGCIPVYHESKCCPIEFYCPDENNVSDVIPLENFLAENSETEMENKCVFGDKSFEIGKELPMENSCITCTCLVPPEFTCVHRSCPSSPSLSNCTTNYLSNSCCPSYDCLSNDESETDFTNSSENVCPTPQCADASCVIQIPVGHHCPTCVCDESVTPERNMLENNEEFLTEGPNISNSSDAEVNENFETEVLIPIEANSHNNKSEKFIESLDSFDEVLIPIETDSLNNKSENIIESYNNFEAEVFIPIEDSLNNKSEKFVESSDNFEINDRGHMEYEINKDSDAFEKDEIFEDNEELFEKEQDHINLEIFPQSSYNISENDESERETPRKKRAAIVPLQQQGSIQTNQISQNSQQQFFEEEDPEPRHEISEEDDEGFDELKLSSMNRKNIDESEETVDEDLISSESVVVRAGCPTPLCANSSCKIRILPGHLCPTCVCTNGDVWQP